MVYIYTGKKQTKRQATPELKIVYLQSNSKHWKFKKMLTNLRIWCVNDFLLQRKWTVCCTGDER